MFGDTSPEVLNLRTSEKTREEELADKLVEEVGPEFVLVPWFCETSPRAQKTAAEFPGPDTYPVGVTSKAPPDVKQVHKEFPGGGRILAEDYGRWILGKRERVGKDEVEDIVQYWKVAHGALWCQDLIGIGYPLANDRASLLSEFPIGLVVEGKEHCFLGQDAREWARTKVSGRFSLWPDEIEAALSDIP